MQIDNKAMARVDKLVQLGALFSMIDRMPGKVPPRMVKQLESYRLPLQAMTDGNGFGEIAGKHIEVIDCLQAYVRTGDRKLLELGREKYGEATVLINALEEKVRNDGVQPNGHS